MYTRARQMPVAICIMKSVSVALPNTYHHDALLRGTWCSITGRTMAPSPARSSSHWLTDRIKGTWPSHLAGESGKLAAADPELTLADLVLVLEEPARRRSGGARAVLVVDAAVTGAHEELGLREPAHGTAKVGTVDREDLEALAVDAPHPARDLGGVAVPLHAERVLVMGEAGLSDREAVHPAQLDPGLAATEPPGGGKDVADDGDAHKDGAEGVESQAEFEEEAASRGTLLGKTFMIGAHGFSSLSSARRVRAPVGAERRARPRRRRPAPRRAAGPACSRASPACRGRSARRSPSCAGTDRSPGRGTTNRPPRRPWDRPFPPGRGRRRTPSHTRPARARRPRPLWHTRAVRWRRPAPTCPTSRRCPTPARRSAHPSNCHRRQLR